MTRYKSLIALNLSAFLLMLGIGMIMALLPQRIMDLSNSVSMVGYLACVFAVPYVLLQVPVGNLADKMGFKTLLTIGYVLCGLTGLLYYLAETPAFLFLGRLLQGAGEVPVWALAPALLSLQYPKIKGRVMGVYNACFHLGLAAGPLVGILLVQVTGRTDTAFAFYAIVSFVGGLIIHLLVDDSNTETSKERLDLDNILALLLDRQSLVVLAGIALYGTGYGLAGTLVPAFLISVKGFDRASIGLFFSLFYVAISLSQIVAGPLSDRRGRRGVMVWGMVLAASGLLLFPSLQQPWINGALMLASLGLGVFYVSSIVYLNEKSLDSSKGSISGAYYFFWGLGYFLGPLIAGRLGNLMDQRISFYLLSGLLLVEAICLIVVGTRWRESVPGRRA